jgi:hypothetical protein
VRCTTARLKQDKRDNVNLKWDSNSISNRWCKIHHQKVLDLKDISRSSLNLTVETEFNYRNWILLPKLKCTLETEFCCRNWILLSELNAVVAEKQCTSRFGCSSISGREAVI